MKINPKYEHYSSKWKTTLEAMKLVTDLRSCVIISPSAYSNFTDEDLKECFTTLTKISKHYKDLVFSEPYFK